MKNITSDLISIRDRMTYRNPDLAFKEAIDNGVLSDDSGKENYAGHYMYMFTTSTNEDAFKHIETRKYVYSKGVRTNEN